MMKQKNAINFSDIKQLMQVLRPLLPHMILTITLGVLGYLSISAISFFGGMAILQWSGLAEFGPFPVLIGIVIAGGVLRAIFRLSEQYCTHYIAFRLLAIVRDRIFEKMRKLGNRQIQAFQKGEFMNVVTKDVELLEVFYAHTIAPVFIGVVTSIIYASILAFFHPLYGIAGLVTYITISYVVPKLVYRFGEKAGAEYRDGFGRLSSFLMDSLKGIKELLVFGAQTKTIGRIDSFSEELNGTTLQLKKHEGLLKAVTDASLYAFVFIQILLTVYLYTGGMVTASEGLLALLLLFSSFGPSLALSHLSASLVHTFASAKSVLRVLNIEADIAEDGEGQVDEIRDITFNQLAFGYEGKPLLYKDVNFTWSKGNIIGIKGENGAGKSTLISLLLHDLKPTEGEILVNHQNIEQLSREKMVEQISMVDAHTTVFSDTLRHNITLYGSCYTDDQILEACKKAGLDEFIAELPDGLDTYLQEFAGNMSSGQLQRLALARLFLKDAPVFILDEPTSNLDVLNEKHILQSIKANAADKLVILISHDDAVLALADDVYLIEDGMIRAS